MEAVEVGGGVVVDIAEAEGLVWTSPETPDLIADFLEAADSGTDGSNGGGNLRWVQLPYAGIEPFLPYLDDERIWTCGKGVYARPVAEHALGLLLAGFRGLNSYVPASTWLPPQGRNLLDSRITILGGGGITEELLHLLAPWRCEVTVVRRHAQPLAGAKAVTPSDLPAALASADAVVLALALTDEDARHYQRGSFSSNGRSCLAGECGAWRACGHRRLGGSFAPRRDSRSSLGCDRP